MAHASNGPVPETMEGARRNLIRRLRDPAFGTETSERNLMNAAADEIERIGALNATLVAAASAVLTAETYSHHVGYDNGPGGGNYIYADVVRTDSESFDKLRAALRTGGE